MLPTPATREMRARYLEDVTKADTLLGEVRAMVREKISGNTIFIYTADPNGQRCEAFFSVQTGVSFILKL